MRYKKVFITRQLPVLIRRSAPNDFVIEACWDVFSLQLDNFKTSLNAACAGIIPFVPESENERDIIVQQLAQRHFYPVFIDQQAWNNFNEFCDDTLNAISSFAPSQGAYKEDLWRNYHTVLREMVHQLKRYKMLNTSLYLFGQELALLPSLLNMQSQCGEINYFYLNAFPHYDIYQALPWATEFLTSLGQCDYLVFENYNDRINFYQCYERDRYISINGSVQSETSASFMEDVFVLPLGIDVRPTRNTLAEVKVQKMMIELREQLKRLQLVFSYFENMQIAQCLKVLDIISSFFQVYPDKINQVSFVIMLNTQLRNFSDSQNLIAVIESKVGHINARYGTLVWKPIHLYHSQADLQLRYAYLRLSDVYLSTNPSSSWNGSQQEYIVAQHNQKGILIDCTAFQDKFMPSNPFSCNINNGKGVSEMLYKALEYPSKLAYFEMKFLYKNSVFNKMQHGILELENKKKYQLQSWPLALFRYS
ncbi:trehalose-6-phosphate synthase [Flavobacterium sp. JP2137]|uniref:trehalose-6-phosphate synthase n=1 Tax=Flavobacterium sp. JP2137 TaxID=3414510 RepID=UPI003D2FA406